MASTKFFACILISAIFLPLALSQPYFDPHNHIGGILPWRSFANLTAFLADRHTINFDTALTLWKFINSSMLPRLDGKDYFPICDPAYTCVGTGALASLKLFQNISEFEKNPEILYGVLERVLTATCFTEFESGYSVKSIIAEFSAPNANSYYMKDLYHGNMVSAGQDYCTAILSELTHSNISGSEQSIGFPWNYEHQCLLDCFVAFPSRGHKMLQFTFSNMLAYYNETHFLAFQNSSVDSCSPAPFMFPVNLKNEAANLIASFNQYLVPSLDNITGKGNPCQTRLQSLSEEDIWDIIVGVDLAGPEVACYNQQGAEFFEDITVGLMGESKRRSSKSQGSWTKPLLFHIHVGEGFSIYYGQQPVLIENATFESVFGFIPGDHRRPNVLTNHKVAMDNIDFVLNMTTLLAQKYPNLANFVVFRFGHLTHLTNEQALRMKTISQKYPGLIEADINIESNLATGAFPLAPSLDVDTLLKPYLQNRTLNFKLNDLSRILVPDASNVTQVGAVYGNFDSLKYLIMYNTPQLVPVMLGTDGTGTEHASMMRAHALAQSLIQYWNSVDPNFRKANVTSTYFFDSVEVHQKRMAGTAKKVTVLSLPASLAVGLGIAIGSTVIVAVMIIRSVVQNRKPEYQPLD